MLGDGFVFANDAKRKAKARTPKDKTGQKQYGKQGQQLPVNVILGDIKEDIAAHFTGDIDFVPADNLTDQFGQAKGEDHEINTRQSQGRKTDQKGNNRSGKTRTQKNKREGHDFTEDCHRIGANAKEHDSRKRDIARRAGKHRPGCGKHGEADDTDGKRHVIAVNKRRQEGKGGKDCGTDGHRPDEIGFQEGCHYAVLPNRPDGLISKTRRKIT